MGDQLLCARHVFDVIMRQQLMKMLVWYAGIRTDFSHSAGTFGKHLRAQLEPGLWRSLERTYADHQNTSTWESLFEMQKLFRKVAKRGGAAFGYAYPDHNDARVSSYARELSAKAEKHL